MPDIGLGAVEIGDFLEKVIQMMITVIYFPVS